MIISTSKLKGIIWLSLGMLTAGVIAVGLPAIISKVPWSYEKNWANKLSVTASIQLCAAPLSKSDLALEKLLKSIYPLYPEDHHFDIELHVARGPMVNAFAHLGGKIYIFEGLLNLANSANEIAGILAHEIAHVARRHILQGVATKLLTLGALQMIFSGPLGTSGEILNLVLGMHFTREQESEADQDGLARLKQASVNPLGFAQFFKRLERLSSLPDFLSDHPASVLRALNAKKISVENPIEILSPAEWQDLKNICEKMD